jgi:hypothetical protein
VASSRSFASSVLVAVPKSDYEAANMIQDPYERAKKIKELKESDSLRGKFIKLIRQLYVSS